MTKKLLNLINKMVMIINKAMKVITNKKLMNLVALIKYLDLKC